MALGKGLSALLDDAQFDYDRELNSNKVLDINLSYIKANPFQPRKNFDESALKERSASIKEHGLIQPIVVLKRSEKDYLLIAGERRMRATKMLGKTQIKAIVLSTAEKNLRELALIENIQRENLNPIELAKSLKELISEHDITQEELASSLKKSRTWVTNTLRLLSLDEKTQKLIEDKKISSGHAKVLVGLSKNDEKMLAHSIVGQNLSVRDTEELVKKIKNPKSADELNSGVLKLKNRFKELGFSSTTSGNKITLSFKELKEIDKLLAKLSKV